jgi:hypothetical protein
VVCTLLVPKTELLSEKRKREGERPSGYSEK